METKFIEIVSNLLNNKNLPPLAFFAGLASFVAWYSFNGDLYYLVIGLAFLGFSIYAFIRNCYKHLNDYRKDRNAQKAHQIIQQRENEKKRIENLAEVSHIFLGLSEENKHNLAYIVLKGEKDMVYSNRFIFKHTPEYFSKIYFVLSRAQEATTFDGDGISYRTLVFLNELYDSTTVEIHGILLEFINQYIKDNNITLSSYEQQDE